MKKVIVKEGIIRNGNGNSTWLLPNHAYHITDETDTDYQFEETQDMKFPKSWFVEYTGQKNNMVVTVD